MPFITRNSAGEIEQKFENLQFVDQEFVEESAPAYKAFVKRGFKPFSLYQSEKVDELRLAREEKLLTVSLSGMTFDSDDKALLRLQAAVSNYEAFTTAYGLSAIDWRAGDNQVYRATKQDLQNLICIIFKQEYAVRTKIYPAIQRCIKNSKVKVEADIYLNFFNSLDLSGLSNSLTDLNKDFSIVLSEEDKDTIIAGYLEEEFPTPTF